MVKQFDSKQQRLKRHKRVRANVKGTQQRPRLCVFRSANNIYVQVIDDINAVTLAAASTLDKEFDTYGGNIEAAKQIGKNIAERAKSKGVSEVVFDRGGFAYHGRVKALAEAARESGLVF